MYLLGVELDLAARGQELEQLGVLRPERIARLEDGLGRPIDAAGGSEPPGVRASV